jgi:RNA polymerase sigma-70 factor (ECF subfamily)
MHPDTTRDDEEIMEQVAQGQTRRLEVLVRRHATRLLTFIQRMVGDRHRSEELFQEVFLAVWIKRRQYAYPRPFKPWLYAIALNRCRADFRVRPALTRAGRAEALTTVPDDHDSPSDTAMAGETAILVSGALAELPPQQRAVVTLRIWDELPYSQIAEIIGCTEATARSHMHHALTALRRHLEPQVK